MSFISDKVNEYNNNQSVYSIADLEKIIADRILDSAKSSIEHAINRGENFTRWKYEYSEGCMSACWMYETAEEYLKSSSCYLSHFADLICSQFETDKNKIELRQLVYQNQKKLNLTNIEKMVREGIKKLGAKQVTVYVRFCEYAYVTTRKQGFFRNYDVEEMRPLGKYKICYAASW